MSSASPVPYVAPWQSSWERFSTQVYSPTVVGQNWIRMVVPDGQWWRVVYVYAAYYTGSTTANRTLFAQILDATGAAVFVEAAILTQPAGNVWTYLWAPGVTAYGNSGSTTAGQSTMTLPDMLWPQGFTVEVKVDGFQSGDGWQAQRYAIEVYTEDTSGSLTPSLTPTPLIA